MHLVRGGPLRSATPCSPCGIGGCCCCARWPAEMGSILFALWNWPVLLMCAVAARDWQRFARGVELACSALVRGGRHDSSGFI